MLKGSARTTGDELEVSLVVQRPPEWAGRSGGRAEGPDPVEDPPDDPAAADGEAKPWHSPDFATVNWFGTVYHFSHKQRLVVANLWAAWEETDGQGVIGQAALLSGADSGRVRLRDVFDHGGHPAWGTMIVQAVLRGGPRDGYLLVRPDPVDDTDGSAGTGE